jgi:transcriptional regulator with XRE-family HTH domain
VQINRFALTDFMEGEGLRLVDLAEKSGVSISFLSALRSGDRKEVSAKTLKKIADALGVRVRSLAVNPNAEPEAVAS